MGRKLLPEGRRTVVGVRLSDAVLALLDEARGAESRSEWLAGAVESRLGMMGRLPGQIPFVPFGGTPPEPPPPEVVEDAIVYIEQPPERRPKAAAPVAAELARERAEDQREAAKPPRFPCCAHCRHPGPREGHDVACGKCGRAKGRK